MSMTDPISDMLTRIRNALAVGKEQVSMPSSKLKVAVAVVLEQEGYIKSHSVTSDDKPLLVLTLKYIHGNISQPVIAGLKRESRPGLRRYEPASNLPKILDGLGVAIVTTNKGVMSDRDARAQNLGGEILCTIW